MARPTMEDAIAVLAKQARMTPESMVVAEFTIPSYSSWGDIIEPRVCSFRHDPKVIKEAEGLLRIYDQVEKMSRRMQKPPFRNPARPSHPTA